MVAKKTDEQMQLIVLELDVCLVILSTMGRAEISLLCSFSLTDSVTLLRLCRLFLTFFLIRRVCFSDESS